MKLKYLVLAFCIPAVFTVQAELYARPFIPGKISTNISLGSLSGKTKERVYAFDEGGRKISQLDWKYNNAAIIKGALTWDIMTWLSVGASGWTTIDSRRGYMTDTDWLDTSKPHEWTNYSWHPKTRLNFANEFDLNIKGWILNEMCYRLGIMAGYQESRYSFKAVGGSYIYPSNEGVYDRGRVGTIPADQRGIGYKQRFRIPYIGLVGSYRYENFEFGGAFKYSNWVSSSDNDEHYHRSITFRENFKNQRYYSLAANVGYYFIHNAKIYAEGTWSRINNKKGDASIYDYSHKLYGENPGGGGIENYNFITTVGLVYHF
ncbi:omptin family outer membrane protease [Salmonella enterica]|nr:omptin family outer membrane protease [Salmonella enterica]EAV4982799.1 omptin family outer membrane protease [Salmonella enterica]EIY5515263.1 omptin family outer membrane protease [Salmonella enterica]EKI4847562.1 omptin family outer membrane protease [Salmonella enterica]ELO2817112.1 omptin family outer membrane protease [Salmonella enterica]